MLSVCKQNRWSCLNMYMFYRIFFVCFTCKLLLFKNLQGFSLCHPSCVFVILSVYLFVCYSVSHLSFCLQLCKCFIKPYSATSVNVSTAYQMQYFIHTQNNLLIHESEIGIIYPNWMLKMRWNIVKE